MHSRELLLRHREAALTSSALPSISTADEPTRANVKSIPGSGEMSGAVPLLAIVTADEPTRANVKSLPGPDGDMSCHGAFRVDQLCDHVYGSLKHRHGVFEVDHFDHVYGSLHTPKHDCRSARPTTTIASGDYYNYWDYDSYYGYSHYSTITPLPLYCCAQGDPMPRESRECSPFFCGHSGGRASDRHLGVVAGSRLWRDGSGSGAYPDFLLDNQLLHGPPGVHLHPSAFSQIGLPQFLSSGIDTLSVPNLQQQLWNPNAFNQPIGDCDLSIVTNMPLVCHNMSASSPLVLQLLSPRDDTCFDDDLYDDPDDFWVATKRSRGIVVRGCADHEDSSQVTSTLLTSRVSNAFNQPIDNRDISSTTYVDMCVDDNGVDDCGTFCVASKRADATGCVLLSDFAGIDVPGLGLAALGVLQKHFAFEIDPVARKFISDNFNGVSLFGSVLDRGVSDACGADVVTAGFPCQPFSLLGLRQGWDDQN